MRFILISIRPIRVNSGAAARVPLVVSTILSAVQRVPRPVLTAMPTAVRIILLDD